MSGGESRQVQRQSQLTRGAHGVEFELRHDSLRLAVDARSRREASGVVRVDRGTTESELLGGQGLVLEDHDDVGEVVTLGQVLKDRVDKTNAELVVRQHEGDEDRALTQRVDRNRTRRQNLLQILRGNWSRDQVPLTALTAQVDQFVGDLRRLDALGDHLQTQGTP